MASTQTQAEKKLIDCYWFLQNQCNKGEACEYRHSKAVIDNTAICKLWTEGKCTNRDCTSRHPSGVGPQVRATVCYYFLHGGCMKGSSCPFSHSAAPGATPITDDATEEKRKIQEELRILQEARKKEEERLSQLRSQAEQIATKKANGGRNVPAKPIADVKPALASRIGPKQPQQQKKKEDKAQNKTNTPPQPVVKKSKSQEPKSKSEIKGAKNIDKTQKAPSKPDQTPAAKGGKVDFGVKSFEDLMKERQTEPKEETSPTQTKTETSSKKSIDLSALRKKNEMKFKSEIEPKVDSPKRKTTDGQETEDAQKRPKQDSPSPSPTPTQKVLPIPQKETPITPVVVPVPQATSTTEDDDLNFDEDLDIDIGTDMGGDPLDDKEFEELMQ